jgi:hypothetical protein
LCPVQIRDLFLPAASSTAICHAGFSQVSGGRPVSFEVSRRSLAFGSAARPQASAHGQFVSGLIDIVGMDWQDRSSRLHRPTPRAVIEEIERLRRQPWTGKQIAAYLTSHRIGSVGHRVTGTISRCGELSSWHRFGSSSMSVSMIPRGSPSSKSGQPAQRGRCRFLEAAVGYFAELGIRIERVMTDNGLCYRSSKTL